LFELKKKKYWWCIEIVKIWIYGTPVKRFEGRCCTVRFIPSLLVHVINYDSSESGLL
jgi:hypothetical protein